MTEQELRKKPCREMDYMFEENAQFIIITCNDNSPVSIVSKTHDVFPIEKAK